MYVNNVANSGDGNVIRKGTENRLKYKDLTIQIQRMWNVKIRNTSNKNNFQSFRKYLSNILGKQEIKNYRIQSAIMGTARTLW